VIRRAPYTEADSAVVVTDWTAVFEKKEEVKMMLPNAASLDAAIAVLHNGGLLEE
jgi:hypothetical protein